MTYTKTKEILNQAVADLSQLSALVHQTHWYMRGAGFLKLHPLMDSYRDDVEAQLDEVSERLITIDGAPYSTLEEFAKHSQIKLAPTTYNVSTQDRFAALVTAFRQMSELYQSGIEAADTENDPVTADILTTAKGSVDKAIWMFQAELGQAPGLDK